MYHTHNGIYRNTTFRVSSDRKAGINYNKLKGIIGKTYERLKNVKI